RSSRARSTGRRTGGVGSRRAVPRDRSDEGTPAEAARGAPVAEDMKAEVEVAAAADGAEDATAEGAGSTSSTAAVPAAA
ncbi:hypothetical protein, partial [Streptomyces sp. NPDC001919]